MYRVCCGHVQSERGGKGLKTHTIEVLVFSVLAGKMTLRWSKSLLSSNVRLVTASRPYACHAQPFYPSRMAFHFLWLSPFRLPVDPHRVRRIHIVALVCTTYLSPGDKWLCTSNLICTTCLSREDKWLCIPLPGGCDDAKRTTP